MVMKKGSKAAKAWGKKMKKRRSNNNSNEEHSESTMSTGDYQSIL